MPVDAQAHPQDRPPRQRRTRRPARARSGVRQARGLQGQLSAFVPDAQGQTEDDSAPWTDVADVEDDLRSWPPPPRPPPASSPTSPPRPSPGPAPTPFSAREKAIFLDLDQWDETANGNPTIVMRARGRRMRVVLFKHKQTPTFGYLITDIAAEAKTFSNVRYPNRAGALLGAWEALCAI
jgi:hypothetical protein